MIIVGVRKNRNKWEVSFQRKGKNLYLGSYETQNDAEKIANEFLKNEFTENLSKLNLTEIDIKETEYKTFYVSQYGHFLNKFGQELIGHIDRSGYREVCISANGTQKSVLLHRLLLKTFYPIANMKDYDVNHIDGNKLNNCLSNLEWCTRSENVLHSYKIGLQDNVAGVKVYSQKEKDFIKTHLYDSPSELAILMNRNEDTIRHYQYKFRKELT